MKKQLFFDDNMLFGIENVVRKYGEPKLVATYNDGVCSTDYCTGWVFPLDNGKYRMVYFGHSLKFEGRRLFSAISDDGVNFSPEKINNADEKYSHEIMQLPSGGEVAFIYEDKYCDNHDERYKLLMSDFEWSKFEVKDTVYVSPDLINWKIKEGVLWGDGAEPLASAFYNKKYKTHTIIERPFWGVRRVGYKETTDWENFSEYRECLNVDCFDEPLSEIYGMYAFEYDEMYIGLPHIYRIHKNELNAKYKGGIVDTQLAYSYDGRYWQRSLREPFITGLDMPLGKKHGLMWVFNTLKREDGNISLYASASEQEHGNFQAGTGKILIYNLRCDGFISLCSENTKKESMVTTREKIWHSGEAHINIKAQKATLGVYISDESDLVDGNVLGISKPIEGYTHEDCIPFSGDSTDWVPQFKSGKKIDELKGKTLVFELKFCDGEVFSFSGEYTDAFNTQAAIYRKYGKLPE